MSRRSKEKRRQRAAGELVTRREAEEREKKRAKRLRIILISVAIVALVAIIVVGVISLVVSIINTARVDYEKDDLSQYIYISPDDYKNYLAEVTADAIDDVTIDSELIRMLAEYRIAPEGASGRWFFPGENTVLGVGDAVRILYRGYTVDDEGNKIAFDGGSNIESFDGDANIDETADETYIGEGGFIDGFELGLIGKKPYEYSQLKLITNRETVLGDVISITCSITPPDSKDAKQDVTLLVELTADAADSIYGLGFAERFVGKKPGDTVASFATDDCYGVSGKTVFTNISVDHIYDLGENPLSIPARFPVDYSEESLAGKICYFDIYVKQYNDYSVPEIDDDFVTEKLGLDLDEFNLYTGDTTYEKLRSYVKEAVLETDASAIRSLVESVMWEIYLDKTVVKRLPKGEVNEYYEDYLEEVNYAYQNANSGGTAGSLDSYALTYLELEAGTDWQAHLYSVAEDRVTEKLAFYYVIRAEGFMPTEEEFNKKYSETVDEYIVSYLEYNKQGTTREDYETDAEFEKAWSDAKAQVFAIYDEEYFRENVVYLIGVEKLIDLADERVVRGPSFTPEQYTPIKL